MRARLERTGDVESGSVALILDLERALLALYSVHPEAAIVVSARMFFEPAEISELDDLFRSRMSAGRMITKATAWLSAYMNGLPITAARGTPSCESAWRGAR